MWIKTDLEKPKEGQDVFAIVHSWAMEWDGNGNHNLRDCGRFVLKSWYTNHSYPMETGHFLDGFLFQDESYPGTLHKKPKVTYWMAIPDMPDDA